MMINLTAAFSLRCAECGYLGVNQVNIFEINKPKIFHCRCGRQKYKVKRTNNQIKMVFDCLICGCEHIINLSQKLFWSSELNSIICPRTNRELGYFGNYEKIRKILYKQRQDLKDMADKSGLNDFVSPGVLLEIMDYLHDLASRKALYCECGSKEIYIDLFDDSIRLFCNICNNYTIIPASSEKDLKEIQSLQEIELKMPKEKDPNNSKDPWINI